MAGFTPQSLTALLHQDIPITEALGIEVIELTGSEITIKAPLDGNTNVHGTAFAGSLYSVMSVAGWALVAHMCRVQLGNLPTVVLKHGSIKYRRPLADNLIAISILDDKAVDHFVEQYQQHHKASIKVVVAIKSHDKLATEFTGEYVVVQN